MKKRARNKRPPLRAAVGYRGWGGYREGAGRSRSARRARTHAHPSEPHKPRPPITSRDVVHVIARFVRGVSGNLDIGAAVSRALDLSRERDDFSVIDLRLRRDAIELVIEASDRRALARGMQGFQVSAARGINRVMRRRGGVFADRYRVMRRRGAFADRYRANPQRS